MSISARDWEFWIDRGGTFTDIVARLPDGGLKTHKLLSENPERYRDAAIEGMRILMGVEAGAPLPSDRISAVKMGTTVATNALLERRGARVLMLMSEGFGDLLRIGYQNRPKLFDLEIKRPAPLYEDVVEIAGRLDFEGKEISPLDEKGVISVLERGKKAGISAVSIAFIHSYLNPAHERRVAEIAADMGFEQISPSYQASPLVKIVGRAGTALVDAYLSPILRGYVDQVGRALNGAQGGAVRLLFMRSSGGLTEGALFQGKDAILSGPAGGIVGMTRFAEAAGFHRLIGFDMGGTSTDVSHFAGRYERSFESEVAGAHIRAPMMDIHTIAAGGGSILSFQQGRYQVGPESAGSDPGPACYRRGGPLCVTDCNVILGILPVQCFPAVFGPNGDAPLDRDVTARKFKALADEITRATGKPAQSPEQVAAGFIRIAVGNMASAIKKISVERGHDVTGYTLNCFGGAGGQHACEVADALGIERIFVAPFSGVLSACGMGLAEIRAQYEAQLDCPIEQGGQFAAQKVDELAARARLSVSEQGVCAADIRVESRAYLRYEGSHQNLEVSFSAPAQMAADFEDQHRARFGFISPSRAIFIDMVCAEAIGAAADLPTPALPAETPAEPRDYVQVFSQEHWSKVPIYEREGLAFEQSITGPAIIREATGTNFVTDGWVGQIDERGNLILERREKKIRPKALGTSVDPVLLEVFNNLFMSVAEQMGATLANTSWSVNIKERLDFSCAIFDIKGDLVANAPHVPVHLGSMSESVKAVIAANEGQIKLGDAFMLNSPYAGGTHLPDVTIVTPIFVQARIVFWLGSRGHHADIGGRTPGSAPPDSVDIEEEGVLVENFCLMRAGAFLQKETEELLGSGRYPCRVIPQNIADLKAQIAANETGRHALLGVVEEYGLEMVQAYMDHVQRNAEACVREVVALLKPGSFTYPMDHGAKIQVQISVDSDKGEAVIDFTGTSSQHHGNFNAPRAISRAVVLYVFRTLVSRPIPLNEGCLKPLKIIIPEDSLLNPRYPAAVIAGNTEISQAVCNALYGALNVMAGSQGTMNNFVWGNEGFQNYETIAGGSGAGPGFQGADAVQTHMTNTLMTDPEILEKRFPVRLESFAVRDGSGGAGKWRGGHGSTRVLRFLASVKVTTICAHRLIAPFGAEGGEDGAVGKNMVRFSDGREQTLKGCDEISLSAGDCFVMHTPGGGGWGKKE